MGSELRFYRKKEESAIGGVASAIARISGMPVMLSRILFVLSIFVGVGIPLYLFVWFVSPLRLPDGEILSSTHRLTILSSLLLIPILGVVFHEGFALGGLDAFLLASATAIGYIGLQRGRRAGINGFYYDELPEAVDDSSLHFEIKNSDQVPDYAAQLRPDSIVGGVCAELSYMTGLNVMLVRIVMVIASAIPVTFPGIPILYGVSVFLLPRRRRRHVHEG